MNEIVKFENTSIDVQNIEGVWMFELYSVGAAIGQVKIAKGKVYPRKDRIDENVKNAEIKPVLYNAKTYITESQLYDLMLEARTDKCRAFRKWLTNEVLPELNHTGSYSMQKQDKQLELYDYFDKTYKGEPVLSSMDVSYFTNINYSVADWHARTHLIKGTDYYSLKGDELRCFKQENPKVSRLSSTVIVFTRCGFDKICKAYGIEIETPKLFIEEKKVLPAVSKLKEPGIPCYSPNVETYQVMEEVRKKAMQVHAITYLLTRPNLAGISRLYRGELRVSIQELNSMIDKLNNLKLE